MEHLDFPDTHLAQINRDSLVSHGWNASPIKKELDGRRVGFNIWKDDEGIPTTAAQEFMVTWTNVYTKKHHEGEVLTFDALSNLVRAERVIIHTVRSLN